MGSLTREPWGEHDGRPVELFTWTSATASGLRVQVSNWGATIVSVRQRDRHGVEADVVLGFDTLDEYLSNPSYFGAMCGRVAGRIANASFVLGAQQQQQQQRHELSANDGAHCLHGGSRGFSHRLWDADLLPRGTVVASLDGERQEAVESDTLQLRLESPAGEQGFPGTVSVVLRMRLTADDALLLEVAARCTDGATPIMLTNHSYFNLAGDASGSVVRHEVLLAASRRLEMPDVLPSGRVLPVAGSVYDLTKPGGFAAAFATASFGGFDDSFVLDDERDDANEQADDATALLRLAPTLLRGTRMRRAATIVDAASGRSVCVETTQPIAHIYTAAHIEAERGRRGCVYGRFSGVCVETQGVVNAINMPLLAEHALLRQGDAPYLHTTSFRFKTQQM